MLELFWPVHPHARGDDPRPRFESGISLGTPPRAWGRHSRHPHMDKQSRYTPTRVGTTSHCCHLTPTSPVHPHARGDDGAMSRRAVLYSGTPPRAWGRRRFADVLVCQLRYTPTRVGTTPASPRRMFSRTVHPHARGDDLDAEGTL